MENNQPALNRIEQARLNNALRVGRRIEKLLTEGYIIFDENGNRIQGEVVFEGFQSYDFDLPPDQRPLVPGWGIRRGNCTVVMFHGESHTANGMEKTIKEYNADFKKWTAIHPRQARRII